MRKKPSRLPALIVLLLLSSPLTVQAGDQGLSMLTHPFLTAPELHKRFTPLAHYLSKETGMSPVKDTDYDSLRQVTEAMNRSDQ